MPAITMFFGLLFLLLGGGVYAYLGITVEEGDKVSPTALIPAIPGLLLLVLGLAGLVASLRPHAMHGAALVGLLALLAGGGKAAMDMAKAGGQVAELALPVATLSSALMGMLGFVFVLVCVKSFLSARAKRKKLAASAAASVSE
ncbi:MAG: hypothetical protein AAGB29_04465 [Planctomycetota bacterium]